ncbi:BTAD domain-containing putative transcriptional regulator [Streptomyces sp. NPDC041068]|uniref:AfsR/SARP family transcriptional regulator n=1 Tax=Streptomyces sp. NPDC041068 TaxID=3155130 RepID=UPI00340E2DE4
MTEVAAYAQQPEEQQGTLGMEFGILGPLQVTVGDRQVPVGGPRQRTILAMMLLAQGQVVSVDRLVDVVWDGRPPATARTQVAICIAGLRKTFKAAGCAEDPIVTAHPGYLLRMAGHRVDAVDFAALVGEAQQAAREGRAAGAEELYRRALGLWRGPALAGVAGRPMEGEATHLEEHRLAAYEEWSELRLGLGQHQALIPELADMTREHPLRERPRTQLMLAQYRAGRRAEALEVFREGRSRFIEELGLEPGPALIELHDAILRDDPALTLTRVPEASARIAEPSVIPAHLPSAGPVFVGRQPELAALDALVRDDTHPRPGEQPPVIGFVSGIPGVGKTSLALRWAHRYAGEFPDGQLFADLGGRGGQEQVAAGDVLARFLRALGVPDDRVPADLGEREALYRSVLATRHILLVLDDAQSFEQLRPLLPGSGRCRVVVTSRAQLDSAAAACGSVRLNLGMLHESEAVELLARVAGEERIAAEPAHTARLAALCDRLPLALRIAASRLAAKPHWTVRHLTARLADDRRRLSELCEGDPALRAGFDLGYRRLPPDAAAMYRRLGLLEAPDFAAWAGAAVLDTDVAEAERLMEYLVDAQLLRTVGMDATDNLRYRLPDLLRLHARERAEAEEPADERDRVLDRVLRSWLTIAEEAYRRENGGKRLPRQRTTLRRRIETGYLDELLASPHEWLKAEQRALKSVIAQSRALGRDELAFDLALSTGLRDAGVSARKARARLAVA